jgi:hypothetical protein
MFATLFAVMSSWVGILVLLVIAAVVWLLMKAAADLVTWFREEVLDDPIQRNREARNRRDSQEKVARSRLAGRDSSRGRRAEP